MLSEFDVQMPNLNDTGELRIIFKGPKDSPYENVSEHFFIFVWVISFFGQKISKFGKSINFCFY